MKDGISRRNLFKVAGGAAVGGLALYGLNSTAPIARAHLEDGIDVEIVITMNALDFTPEGGAAGDAIRVPAGQVVRLVFINASGILHDAHFGTDPNLTDRYYNNNVVAPFEMLEIPDAQESWITFTFTDEQKGEYEMGCFQPGHYEGGMHNPFIVE
jgi:uncharacterized cupredoxin-like copper-binding protein